MFSGIVEANVMLLEWTPENQIVVEKPSNFKDLKTGNSLAVNGVCLTLEWQDEHSLRFSLGPETLKVTGWSEKDLRLRALNIERSLRMGDRIHGHMVAGHVDAMGTVCGLNPLREALEMRVQIPATLWPLVWKKGSLAINGVSLTVNDITAEGVVSVCLISETLKRTNLGQLTIGDSVTLEADTMARVMIRQLELKDTNMNRGPTA